MKTQERICFVRPPRVKGVQCNEIREKNYTKKRFVNLWKELDLYTTKWEASAQGQHVKVLNTYDNCSMNQFGRKPVDNSTYPRQQFIESRVRHWWRKVYQIQLLNALNEENYRNGKARCSEIEDQIENESLMDNILFSDQATYDTWGEVTRHNCRVRSNEKPSEDTEWQRASPKFNVWLGMTKWKIYGPFFRKAFVTGTIRLDMLQQFLDPYLGDDILDDVVLQQDRAPCL